MSNLNQLIEEEKKRLVAKFIKKVSDWREGNGHTCDYIECSKEDFEQELSLSLQRIAKITAKEIVPRPKEHLTPNTGNTYNQGKIEGYNHYFVALQTKIKEFGI